MEKQNKAIHYTYTYIVQKHQCLYMTNIPSIPTNSMSLHRSRQLDVCAIILEDIFTVICFSLVSHVRFG